MYGVKLIHISYNFCVLLSLLFFVVNDLVTKYKLQKEGSAKHKCYPAERQRILDAVSTANEDGIEICIFFIIILEGKGGLEVPYCISILCATGSTGT